MLRCLRRTRTCNRGARDRGTGSGNRGGLVFVAWVCGWRRTGHRQGPV